MCFTRLLCELKLRRQIGQRNGRSGVLIGAPFAVCFCGDKISRAELVGESIDRFIEARAIRTDVGISSVGSV